MNCNVISYNTIVIGSGCAGFNAADWLYDLGVRDIAIVTEGINMGTSRNTGSDKQTYYKLALAGDVSDSVYEMAETLFGGGGVHGDTALIESACSSKAFMKLVHYGLPFPTNRFGAYIGYKTDHDPGGGLGAKQRATSCGPLTSKLMTEALERSVKSKDVSILDQCQVIKILTSTNKITGLVLLDKNSMTFKTLSCKNIILATGGPAGIYESVVFPESQHGATGLALDAGAAANNLCEWQYGLASTDFRWNVSGTYQQVLPRYISVDESGNEHEFISPEDLSLVFLKGYQWPFDVQKTGPQGSSQIDLKVADENEKGRTVYMDFRRNPSGLDFNNLSEEAYTYLEKSGALFGLPIDRLAKMNPKSIQLYKDNGIDLYKEPLKVAVCAQHCNGGISVNANWESTVQGLFVVGEAAGTFGVYRPGGSALNSTQVGSMRAAEHIAYTEQVTKTEQVAQTEHITKKEHVIQSDDIDKREQAIEATILCDNKYFCADNFKSKNKNPFADHYTTRKDMSRYAAYVRSLDEMRKLHKELLLRKENYFSEYGVASDSELPEFFKCYDALVTQVSVLSSMIFAAENIGSRGSALVKNTAGHNPADASDSHDFTDDTLSSQIVTTDVVTTVEGRSYFEPVRPLPVCDDWFENVYSQPQ